MVKPLVPTVASGFMLLLAACGQEQAENQQKSDEEATTALAQVWGVRPKRTARTEQQDIEAAILIEAPETGIDLGWGWNTFRAEPVPTVCVEFARNRFDSQTTTLSFKEVNDSFELLETMDVSAEVSVKSIGFSANGKAKFAKEVNISGFSSTFVIEAEVQNGAAYAAPTPPRTVRLAALGVDGEGAVRLTAEAAALARRDIEAFKDVCGNGYVSATMGGAKLTAVVSIETNSRSEREQVQTAVSGSGWGVKVEAAMGSDKSTTVGNFQREISFYQAGGKEQDLPTDAAKILARVEALAKQAATAEKLFQIAVTPYEVLENWPRGEEVTGEEAEFEELAALWGSYNTLYDEIQEAMDAPAEFVVPITVCEIATLPAASDCTVTFETATSAFAILEDLQDEVLAALDRLELDAEACVISEEDCAFAGDNYRSPYAVRARLPIPACFLVAAGGSVACDAANVELGAVGVDLYAKTTIRDMAKSRCRFGSLTPGCLSNADIRVWTDRAGFRSMLLESTDILTAVTTGLGAQGISAQVGDPGADTGAILWYAGNQRAAVETALAEARRIAAEEVAAL